MRNDGGQTKLCKFPKGIHPRGACGVGYKCRVWWELKVFCALQLLTGRYRTSGVGNRIAMGGGEALPRAEVYGLTWTKEQTDGEIGDLACPGDLWSSRFLTIPYSSNQGSSEYRKNHIFS